MLGGMIRSISRPLAAVEENHFWFRARNRVISVLASAADSGLRPGYLALEIGCGNGNVLRHLESTCRGGTVIGMDQFREAFNSPGCGQIAVCLSKEMRARRHSARPSA